MRPYKGLIPPFLLQSIIPVRMVFVPLSFIFWRGIIWIPEMRGKGVSKMGSLLGFFLFGALVSNCDGFGVLKNQKTLCFDLGSFFSVMWNPVGESQCTSWASRDSLEMPLLLKNIEKTYVFFVCFLRMFLFGVFDVFEGCFEYFAFLSGVFSSTMVSNMGIRQGSKQ